MIKYFIIIFIFLATISCKEDMYSGITFEAPVFKDSVYVEAIPFQDTLLTRFAWGMASYKNYVVLLAEIDDHMLHLFDKETGKKTFSFAELGRGPQQVLTMHGFSVNENEGILISYSSMEREILVFYLDSVINQADHFMDRISMDNYKTITFTNSYKCNNGYLLPGGKCEVYPAGSRFILFSEAGKRIDSYNQYPVNSRPTSDSIKASWDWTDLRPQCCISPDGRKFAEGTKVGGILETFTIGKKINPKILKGYFKPYFLRDKNKVIYTPETQFGFYYLTSTNNYLYALSFNGGNSEKYPLCEMQVFDWKGNPVKKYKTNKPLLNVCVDEERGKVYALSQTPMKEFYLISFNL